MQDHFPFVLLVHFILQNVNQYNVANEGNDVFVKRWQDNRPAEGL